MSAYDLVEALSRGQVLEVVWVVDLAGSPFALVGRVVDHRCVPFALILWVGLEGTNGTR